jgi:hypothetical protein
MTKNEFYRYCRLVHGWLSALAFIALCFFSFTGLLLNHPEWFAGSATVEKQSFMLNDAEIRQLRSAAKPAQALVEIASNKIELKGAVEENDAGENDADGTVVGDELFVRLQGVRGESILRAHLESGALEVKVETSSTLTMLNELHRAERAGGGWRLAVDVIAIALILLSLIGYMIFLSMRGARLRTAIVLTLCSALSLGLIFVYAVY